MQARVVVGIPTSFDEAGRVETASTKKYLEYLRENLVETVMTTAGTSTFNLMSVDEVHELNHAVVEGFSGEKIIGVPNLSLHHTMEFVEAAESYMDENTRLMFLYPERYYQDETLISFFSEIREGTSREFFIHGKTLRSATGGSWDYTSSLINSLHKRGVLCGIKEEHSSLKDSYDFVSNLNKNIDVIVAGGSMRRFEYLSSAGANSFLSGVGNLFPAVELEYISGHREAPLKVEKDMFDVFMKIGWHKSLRVALRYLELTCFHDRAPWPTVTASELAMIESVVGGIKERIEKEKEKDNEKIN
tara:strand:- start:6720 stop:7628 length:909 start_codon:yes stop_codon:yes gene_type:complete